MKLFPTHEKTIQVAREEFWTEVKKIVVRSFKKRINHLKKRGGISILGPAPTLPPRVKGEYQWQLLAKSKKGNASDFLKEAVRRFQKSRSVKVIVDVDPY